MTGPGYWQWTLDNSGTLIRNLSSNDFDKPDGISLTVDAVTACIAVDSQSILNDFSKCTDLKNVICQFDNLLTGSTLVVVSSNFPNNRVLQEEAREHGCCSHFEKVHSQLLPLD